MVRIVMVRIVTANSKCCMRLVLRRMSSSLLVLMLLVGV
jgi:hypothetical protein